MIPAAIPTICFAKAVGSTLSAASTPDRVTTVPNPAATAGVIAPKKLLRTVIRADPSNPPINFKP